MAARHRVAHVHADAVRARVSFLRDILTADADSRVYDLVRVGTALSLVIGLGLTVYTVAFRGDMFDLTAFGTGIGLILAGGGGAMALRKDREKPE